MINTDPFLERKRNTPDPDVTVTATGYRAETKSFHRMHTKRETESKGTQGHEDVHPKTKQNKATKAAGTANMRVRQFARNWCVGIL